MIVGAGGGGVAGVSLLSACNLVPFYRKPPVELPVTWKLEGPWRDGTPSDGVPKGRGGSVSPIRNSTRSWKNR